MTDKQARPAKKLPFDPIDEAARQWGLRWDAVDQMHAVTSLMRVQQIVLAQLDDLKPHGLTFARYEALVLLTFSRAGSLPLGKMGERLQVHPTSVTSIVDRLEAAGLVVRRRHPEDGRAVLAEITEPAGPSSRRPRPTWSRPGSPWPTWGPRSCASSPSCSGPCAATPATSRPLRTTPRLRSTEIVGRPTIFV